MVAGRITGRQAPKVLQEEIQNDNQVTKHLESARPVEQVSELQIVPSNVLWSELPVTFPTAHRKLMKLMASERPN